MSNIVSFDRFKTDRNLGAVMTWFEQFQTSPLFMEMIRKAFEYHADHDGEYVLPFTIRAPRQVPGQSLDLSFVVGDNDFASLTLGWMAAPAFATFGVLQAMPSTMLETTETSRAYLMTKVRAMISATGVYDGFGSIGFALGMAVCLLTEIINKTGQIHEYVTPEGDHYFTAGIAAAGADPNDDAEVMTLRIRGKEFARVQESMRQLMKAEIPKAGPSWENVRGGKIRAKIVSRKKPESPLFKKGTNKEINKWIDEILTEEIVGDDREAMERYIRKLLAWHHHYAVHYNMEGWSYEVSWKG